AETSGAGLPFASLGEEEREEVRATVRRFAERLRGAARARERRARRGRLDPHRTMHRSARTAFVPFEPARRSRRRDRPRVVLLCDVSDSVRPAARFMLEFVSAMKELFERTRIFVFVSELGEATRLFEEEPIGVAVARAADTIVSSRDQSNYARVFAAFERE